MNARRVNLYHRLPGPLRTLAGMAHGYCLRRRRYGRGFDRLVAEALERDGWGAARWNAWTRRELTTLLVWAAIGVPFYRDYWSRHPGRDGSVLENWPILEKEQLRGAPTRFLADTPGRTRLYEDHTSGTTGTPLRIWSSRDTLRRWYALFEARGRVWHGVSRRDRWAILGGQLVKPVRETEPPYWIWNAPLRQLYMSTYHLADGRMPHYLDALVAYRIQYLYGYTSALYELAVATKRWSRGDLNLKVVITNAEPVLPYQRRAIEMAFRCPLRETYGMTEMCGGASECEAGGLHLWPDAGIVEVLEGEKPVGPGETGDLVFTGLLNRDMPLIRYRVGDRGALMPDRACPCGRRLPLLAGIEGRCDDVLYTARGERVGRLDPVFKADLPIKMAQVVQDSLMTVRVRYVPATGFEARHEHEIADQLRARLGDIAVVFESVSEIPRGANGKFRAVISNLPASARAGLQGGQSHLFA